VKPFRLVITGLSTFPCLSVTYVSTRVILLLQVLKGVTERAEVALVRLREIKCKIEKKTNVQDRYKNTVSVKDVVRIIDGPCKVRFFSTV
jgi:transcription elongation factor SPT5